MSNRTFNDPCRHFAGLGSATAKQCAHEVENVLRHGDYHNLIENMYENRPDRWHDDLQGLDRLRYSINVFTRMRFAIGITA